MRVLFFGHLKDLTRSAELVLEADDLDTETLWRRLAESYPALEGYRRVIRLARNGEYASPDVRFRSDDEVALIPPVSGG